MGTGNVGEIREKYLETPILLIVLPDAIYIKITIDFF